MRCPCNGCDGHGAWKAEQKRIEAERLAENTKRFDEWRAMTPEQRAALKVKQGAR
jgi:hypothetical protein